MKARGKNNSLDGIEKINSAQKNASDAFIAVLKAERRFYLDPTELDKVMLERAKSVWQACHKEFLISLHEVIKKKVKNRYGSS